MKVSSIVGITARKLLLVTALLTATVLVTLCSPALTRHAYADSFQISLLERWFNPTNGDHGDTHAPLTPPCCGYHLEGGLGYIADVSRPNTVKLMGCMVGGWDEFSSTDPNCEGQQILGVVGWIWTSPQAVQDMGFLPLTVYRCIVNGNGDHMDSNDPGCEKQHTEGIIGYTIASS
jgi:hypothetical protein